MSIMNCEGRNKCVRVQVPVLIRSCEADKQQLLIQLQAEQAHVLKNVGDFPFLEISSIIIQCHMTC
jgi:hypothetical protein